MSRMAITSRQAHAGSWSPASRPTGVDAWPPPWSRTPRSRRSSASTRRAHPGARTHRVRQGRRPARTDREDRACRPDRHGRRHPAGRRFGPGPGGRRPESAHENNVIGTLNILAACSAADSPVRRLVFKSSAHWYGCAQDDPAFFTEAMTAQAPPETRDRARPGRGRGRGRRVPRARPDVTRDRAAVRQRARCRGRHLARPPLRAAAGADDRRFRPPLPVRRRGRCRPRARARDDQRTCPGSSTSPATAC